ncbi:unnamed protein product [Ectocarpus fasciculatus]
MSGALVSKRSYRRYIRSEVIICLRMDNIWQKKDYCLRRLVFVVLAGILSVQQVGQGVGYTLTTSVSLASFCSGTTSSIHVVYRLQPFGGVAAGMVSWLLAGRTKTQCPASL